MVTPLPPVSTLSPPTTAPAPDILSSTAVAVRVVSSTLPSSGTASPKISGRVVHAGADGQVTIASDRGTVSVKLPDNVRATPGQQVELDLPRDAAAPAQLRATPSPQDTTAARQVTRPDADPSASVPTRTPGELNLAAQLKELSARAQMSQDIKTDPRHLGPGTRVIPQPIALPEFWSAVQQKPNAASGQNTLLPFLESDMAVPVLSDALRGMILTTPQNIRFTNPLMPRPGGDFFQNTPAPPQTSFLTGTTNGILTTPLPGRIAQTIFHLTIPQDDAVDFVYPGGGTGGANKMIGPGTLTLIQTRTPETVMWSSPNTPGPLLPTLPGTNFAGSMQMRVIAHAENGPVILAGSASPFQNAAPQFFQIFAGTPPPAIGTTLDLARGGAGGTGTPSIAINAPSRAGMPVLAPALMQTLNDILDLLAADPLSSGHFSASTGSTGRGALPLPGLATPQNLGAGVFLFLAILRSGDLSGWLDDRMTQTLRRTPRGAGALDKLNGLLDNVSKQLNDSAGGEWRSMPLPLSWQNHVIPTMLHRRNNGDDANEQKDTGAKGQRFILDLSFDRMGAVQMDMLYRDKQLESILRTRLPLSAAMRTILSEKYASAMGKTGLSGALYFQDGPGTWVTVLSKDGMDTRFLA